MDIGDCQLMGQIIDVLHALLHLGQLLLKQLRERTTGAGVKRTEETRKTNATLSGLNKKNGLQRGETVKSSTTACVNL